MKKVFPAVEKSGLFLNFLKAWKGGEGAQVTGAAGSSPAFIFAEAYRRSPHPFVAIVPDEKEADPLRFELEGFLGVPTVLYPAIEILEEDNLPPDPGLIGERQAILASLRNSSAAKPLLIAALSALKQKLPPPSHLERAVLKLEKGGEGEPGSLARKLVAHGYENQSPVLEKGRFDRRGGIIDIYPGHLDYPVRVEFGEEGIESLRHFDPQTQRTTESLEEVEVYPVKEAGGGKTGFFEYLPEGYRLVWFGPFPPEEAAELLSSASRLPSYFFDPYPVAVSPVSALPKAAFAISTLEKFKYRRKDGGRPLLAAAREWLREGFRVIIGAHNPGEAKRLKELLEEKKILPHPRLRVELGEVRQGFIWEKVRLVVMGDGEIFNRYQIPRPRRKYIGKVPLRFAAGFRPGDYVVHLDHGVGRYLGVKKMKVEGKEREMLVIRYAGGSRLYLPLTESHLVSRYMGFGKRRPVLSALGGGRWLRQKAAARRAVQDLSAQLLEVHARRETLAGHAFSPDTPWQKEFEAAFIYPETPDQSTAIAEIKEDMESPKPMDRLLCGDVGYGKTEVAVRAAFKAVLDGKQVAVLVPTTVLAQQHFQTFRERLSDYPVRVEMLSRFLTPSREAAVLEGTAKGAVDIVIGTHRLLQKDISFKELGLVVIDEEQRFGVRHKERFKRMRALVDVLTLTATPIPRTLHLSLSGTRDLSTINTPPQDRLAVETVVHSYNPEEVKTAVYREVGRGGQVFYVHNRVDDIEKVRDKLRGWFPELKVATAHGQMEGKGLASVMEEFTEGKIDVLVCTTIIESGLDIPNANTIIVENAERFGLADLYQLRGRVGRFKRRAYAYFFFPPASFLEEAARKRLQAIREFSHLGAGFSLALRDLEIRGAGNILGKEQHGHIAAVGFELYCRLLRESTSRLKGKEVKEPLPVKLEFDLPGGLPDSYISEEKQRIEMYGKWAEIAGRKELTDWEEELKDRFGPLPEETKTLSDLAELKLKAAELAITSISKEENKFVFRRGKKILGASGTLSLAALERAGKETVNRG